MRHHKVSIPKLVTVAALAVGVGCGPNNPDAKTCGSPTDGGGVLQSFSAPCEPGARGILFTASGEVLGLGGYSFPAAQADDPAFVDGWEVRFTRYIVTFDHITLSESPDTSPTDQSKTGAVVAKVDGPWAVDLHKGGSLPGKGGTGEQAVAIAAVSVQNQKGNAAFDPSQRYAFGFETIAATATAKNVNLDADGLADYREMIQKGYATLIAGTATYRGTNCSTSNASYDFNRLPKTVNFRFGFKTPSQYVNCLNPDLDPAQGLNGEEHQRGVAVKANEQTVAQLTFHSDHPFWDSFEHDSPLHFDQIAARYSGASAAPASTPTATLEDFVGRGFTPFQDAQGNDVPYRSCVESYALPGPSAMSFDTKGKPINPSGDPSVAIRDYADFASYIQSTFGHLNADGLCFTVRKYPSPQ